MVIIKGVKQGLLFEIDSVTVEVVKLDMEVASKLFGECSLNELSAD